MSVVTIEEMRHLENIMMDLGTTSNVLMEKAGKECAKFIQGKTAITDEIVIICGSGNNGGDGFVIARYLFEAGYNVKFILIGTIEKMSNETKVNFLKINQIENYRFPNDYEKTRELIQSSSVCIDAILGIGLKERVLTDIYYDLISLINASDNIVFSIDLPSGIGGNSGLLNRIAVCATYTIAIQKIKIGCLINEGPNYSGEIVVVDIGINDQICSPTYNLVNKNMLNYPKKRRLTSHKYDFGLLKIIAGSEKMLGAGILAATAGIKTGAGLIISYIEKDNLLVFSMKLPPEIMIEPYESDKLLDAYCYGKDADAIVYGPGIARNRSDDKFLEYILQDKVPILIDAGGLYHLEKITNLKNHEAPLIISPHLGEFSMLTGLSKAEITKNLIKVGISYAMKNKLTLILKAHRTMIFSEKGQVFFNVTGNPGMATAGTGDVLSGMIGSILAQGYEPLSAALAGVYYHGLAGDNYTKKYGQTTLIASDLIKNLKEVLDNNE